MVVVLLSWIYIFMNCLLIGMGIQKLLKKIIHEIPSFSLIGLIMTGMVGITIYTEFFSIFYKIGMMAHLMMLLAALISGYFCQKEIRDLIKNIRPIFLSWEGFFYICLLLLISFYTSRGTFHTDTNIYHAANIRLYEEYGLIKGMANLQLHYGYNSAYLAFASIFSLHWLLPFSLHTTTGFVEAVLCIYACHHLKTFKEHRRHLMDAGCLAILIYAVVNLIGSISPATDYPTMFFSLYIITAWLSVIEKQKDQDIYSVHAFSLLSVAAVFVATMKLSAGALVVMVIYPAVCLIRRKKWKEIALYILMGVLVLVPYLIRNVLISGWLIYPFESIDLFQVSWKVPLDYLLVDSYQIKVWGRCLYDVTKIDMPVREWLPVWWNEQERYVQYLIFANILGFFLIGCNMLSNLRKKIKTEGALLCFYLGMIVGLIVWFFLAPFIRYGLAFLLAVPMAGLALWYDQEKKGFYSIMTGTAVVCLFLCLSPYLDYYVTDDGVFLKQQLREPYYILQKDYDTSEMQKVTINGNTLYYSVEGIVNDYHKFPGSCYEFMLERTTLIGDTIEEGFMPK